jgi:hypothetical protein
MYEKMTVLKLGGKQVDRSQRKHAFVSISIRILYNTVYTPTRTIKTREIKRQVSVLWSSIILSQKNILIIRTEFI